MKNLTLLFALFLTAEVCNSQVTIKDIQIATTLVAVDAATPSDPNSYTWSEISNTKQGVHISVVPPERGQIFLQLNNSWINYNTWNWGFMFNLEVNYDNGGWQTIFHNQTKDASGWIQSPFSTLGYHTISIRWIDLGLNMNYRDYDVYVVPQGQKFYQDNYGNTLTSWEGTDPSKVVLISEGFDAYNEAYPEYLRYKGKDLFDPLLQAGYKIYFLNYAYNSQDMRNSAAIYASASRYISALNSNTSMIASGVSMGGVIVRYALAKAENDGSPLPFYKFVSIDGPQQGALIDRNLQDYMKQQGVSDFEKHGLDNDAAKELLVYNTYGDLHTFFYNELNGLNGGTGYPHLTRNVGVSFSSGTANPGNGRWVVITYESIYVPGTYIVKEFDLTSELKVSGSYLPKTLVASNPSPFNFGIFLAGMLSIERDPNNQPTFIPYNSSLDLVNNQTKFFTTIQPNSNYFHDQFPPEIIQPLLNEILGLSVSGEISTNSSWNGNVTVTGPVTVDNGTTLSISPGTIVAFAPSANLYLYGKLIAVGASSQPITLSRSGTSGSWGSMVLSGSGANGSTLSYVNMQYGGNIQVRNNAANVTIQNCNLTNNNGAIDFESSSGLVQNNHISYSADYHGIIVAGGSNVNCYQNTLTKTDHSYYPYYHDVGIYYSGGAGGNIGQNDLDFFSWGIGINYSSSPHFHSPNWNQNNRVTNCYYGINIYNNSYPVIGYNGTDCGGANSIHDNNYSGGGYDIQLYGETFALDALGTYWNGGNPNNAHLYAGSGCSIDTGMPLSTDPWAGIPIPTSQKSPSARLLASVAVKGTQQHDVTSQANGESGTTLSDSSKDPLSGGFQLRDQGKFKEAKDFFVSYIGKNPNDQRAYVELYNCADNTTLPDLIQYFKSLPKQADKEQNLLLSYLYLKQGDVKSARQVNNSVIAANTHTSIAGQAKLNNFYISLYNENDAQAALSILNDVLDKKDLSDPMAISTAEQALHTYIDPKTGTTPYASVKFDAGQDSLSATSNAPVGNGLMTNYPNPFNPSTKITYQLAQSGHVTLKVYDILGREVVTLMNENQSEGIHTASFDGTRSASGVYFYRLTAPGVNQVKKMLLTK
jgi:hypothetical protein